jgi:hypothetical protein
MGLKRLLNKGIAGTALVALATACSSSGESVQDSAYPVAARSGLVSPIQAVVAVPALLGVSIDELSRHLGPPQPVPAAVQEMLNQLPAVEADDSVRFFRHRTLEVLVNYNAKSRRFNDLLLLGPNEDVLMQRAGLSADAATYLLLPVFRARRSRQLLGLRVVPLNPGQLQ